MQLGVSLGGYDLDGRDGDFGADPFSNAAAETQLFTTFGFYKRSDVCQGDRWAWAAVVDLLYDNNFGEEAQEIFNRQTRGYLGYAWDEANEFGTWFRVNLESPFVPGQATKGRLTFPGYENIVMEVVVQKMEIVK